MITPLIIIHISILLPGYLVHPLNLHTALEISDQHQIVVAFYKPPMGSQIPHLVWCQ
jgi:hypothetical protein